jgi:hypothetical protein
VLVDLILLFLSLFKFFICLFKSLEDKRLLLLLLFMILILISFEGKSSILLNFCEEKFTSCEFLLLPQSILLFILFISTLIILIILKLFKII